VCSGSKCSAIGGLHCRAQDSHTVPLGGPNWPFWKFIYSAFRAQDPHAWASQTMSLEAQTGPVGSSHTVPMMCLKNTKPRTGASQTVP